MLRPSSIRSFLLAAGLWAAAAAALAGELPYDHAKFAAAMARGEPVVLDFAASWCPTCRAQKPIVQSLLQEDRRKALTLFLADYDTEVALKKQFGVTQQSTFVVFKGGKEVGRSTGQTQKQAIAELFDKAL
jgi:thiol-disulfide isomerase/thioredoxin